MHHPTISYPRLADAADAQGLKLRHSKHQGVYRWILCRTADGGVAEGAGYSAEKLRSTRRPKQPRGENSNLPKILPELGK